MSYGYTFKERLFSSIKRFFIKTFILLIIFVGASAYFFKSDFGNSVQLIKDFKDHTNQEFSNIYETQTTELSNSIRKDLGLQPVSSKNINSQVNKTSDNNHKENNDQHKETNSSNNSTNDKISNSGKSSDLSSSVESINNSGFPLYKIPFYYDHSNAPKDVSKEEALNLIRQASQKWTEACGITFEYKGDKFADYVNNKNVIDGTTGVIKWETQMDGAAIGEAHVGSSHGPAHGFVLALYSDFFAHNKSDLINTITHEMGHVIGLEHSLNKHSIMFPTEHPSSKLEDSDKAMCRYFRYRWSGMNESQAQDKAGVLSNGGAD